MIPINTRSVTSISPLASKSARAAPRCNSLASAKSGCETGFKPGRLTPRTDGEPGETPCITRALRGTIIHVTYDLNDPHSQANIA